MKKLDQMLALHRDVRDWHTWVNRKALADKKPGVETGYLSSIKRDIAKPQSLEEVLKDIRKWIRMKFPGPYGAIGCAIARGLTKRYVQMSGDTELNPQLPVDQIYRYLDEKFGWTEKEEQKKCEKQQRIQDVQTGFRIRMILGPLTQGMPPAGYKEELRKLGQYKTYRTELELHGWDKEQIDAFLDDLMMVEEPMGPGSQ